jgi:energy-converting hydrogenase Eha subunit G
MEVLLIAILKQIVVPELARFIQQKYAETGKLPTKEEMEAEVLRTADKIIEEGQAFLTRLKNENPQPGTN